jgi:hypothetical protein
MTLANPDQSADLARIVQRQLLLLAHQDPDHETGLYTWPTMSGLSVHQSIRLFQILEREGWIAGFPAVHWGFLCTITDPGQNILAQIRNGRPLTSDNSIEFSDADRSILTNAGSDSVFIVHGDDLTGTNPFAFEVKRHIEAWGIAAGMLDARPGDVLLNAVMRQITNCGAAVCIWDADRDHPDSGNIRPNVTLETGVALGYLGQSKIFVIKRKDNLVSPSDFGGVVWMTDNDWRDKLPSALYGVLRAPM